MPDVKSTIEEIQGVLDAERTDSGWDHRAYAPSAYVYISKKGVAELARLLVRAKDESLWFQKHVCTAAETEKRLTACAEQLEIIADDNDQLRRVGQEKVQLLMAKDARIEQLFKALKSLRSVFGGGALTHEELQLLLRHVDEVLGL